MVERAPAGRVSAVASQVDRRGLTAVETSRSVWAITGDGRRLEGARAVAEALVAARLPVLAAVFRLPGAELLYRLAARNRALLSRFWR